MSLVFLFPLIMPVAGFLKQKKYPPHKAAKEKAVMISSSQNNKSFQRRTHYEKVFLDYEQ